MNSFLLPPFHARGFFFSCWGDLSCHASHSHAQYFESDKIQSFGRNFVSQYCCRQTFQLITQEFASHKESPVARKVAMFHYWVWVANGCFLNNSTWLPFFIIQQAGMMRKARSKHHLMSRIQPHVYNTFTARESSLCSVYLHIFTNPCTTSSALDTCCANVPTLKTSLQHLPSTAVDESPTISQS